uniref:Membrane-spanning 4-domains subfamily A member 8-like n=1 Tax=Salvator merianae TaxID=96440 RepID=A0A8D0B8B7_SALMN
MASGSVMFIPQNGGNVFIGGQPIPGTVIQPAGTVQYVQYVGQPVGSAINQPQQGVPGTALQMFRKAETKTLGAIQIMIGLIHIGFGAVSAILFGHHYVALAINGSYPVWGGIFFIISGSVSVSAEKYLTSSLVKCSVGLNITSALMTLIGIILLIMEFLGPRISFHSNWHVDLISSVRVGLLVLLFLFSLLEFCIAISTAHFGCKAACCKNDLETIVVPYVVSGINMTPAQSNPATASPPDYDSAAVPNKIE